MARQFLIALVIAMGTNGALAVPANPESPGQVEWRPAEVVAAGAANVQARELKTWYEIKDRFSVLFAALATSSPAQQTLSPSI